MVTRPTKDEDGRNGPDPGPAEAEPTPNEEPLVPNPDTADLDPDPAPERPSEPGPDVGTEKGTETI